LKAALGKWKYWMVMNPEKAVIDIARIARVLLVSMIYPTP